MKTIPFLLLIVSLAVAQKPALQKDRQVLFDFRVDRNAASSKISAATQKSVLTKVFRKYLTDPNQCNADFDAGNGADPLAAARKAGQIVPAIFETTTGSFTAPGQTQTLYVISVSECNATHADNFGTKRVAIFSGQKLVADIDVDFKSSIARKTDLNSDGIDELLMASSDIHQGIVDVLASLFSFQNGRLQVIHDFGSVIQDECASLSPGSTTRAAVLYLSDVVPGNMPKLTMDHFKAGCRGAKRWRFLSSGKI